MTEAFHNHKNVLQTTCGFLRVVLAKEYFVVDEFNNLFKKTGVLLSAKSVLCVGLESKH